MLYRYTCIEFVQCRKCTLTVAYACRDYTGWLVLQGIFVLRMPGNVTMSPYWNWTRSWVPMTSSWTTAGGERAVPVPVVLMTGCNRPAVSAPTGLIRRNNNIICTAPKYIIDMFIILCTRKSIWTRRINYIISYTGWHRPNKPAGRVEPANMLLLCHHIVYRAIRRVFV